jgi:hypothetical protein
LGVMAGGESGRRGRLALVVLLFGSILAAGRLVPAVRWFFRQRADRVAEEVGRRGIGAADLQADPAQGFDLPSYP